MEIEATCDFFSRKKSDFYRLCYNAFPGGAMKEPCFISDIKKNQRYSAGKLFSEVHKIIRVCRPDITPYVALFGCSDEVNAATDSVRFNIFGKYGGVFTTRTIGSQIFFHQIQVGVSRGHHSNVFEVNVHIGEMEEHGKIIVGELIGRDGVKRHCCGALAHIIEDFQNMPDEKPSISQSIDGEVYLDFLGTLKWRLKPHQQEILAAPIPILAITHKNLEVQINELIRQLHKVIAKDSTLAPMFVYGTISYNHIGRDDEESLEHLSLITGPNKDDMEYLIC